MSGLYRTLMILSGLMIVSVAPAQEPARGSLITKIVTRTYVISVYSGGSQMRYDVTTLSGKLVAENASLDELQERSPEVYQFVKSAVAIDASNNNGPGGNPINAPTFIINRAD